MTHHGPFSVEQWFDALFTSKAARDGWIMRRQLRDVVRYVGRERLAQEAARRGYHAIENAGQIVIFCIRDPIRRFA
jgi:hypothetical protein